MNSAVTGAREGGVPPKDPSPVVGVVRVVVVVVGGSIPAG